jgi:Flp pilus assembly pilin Flp
MIKEYALIVAMMSVFTLTAVGFVKDVATEQLCNKFEGSASHEFCKKEGSK